MIDEKSAGKTNSQTFFAPSERVQAQELAGLLSRVSGDPLVKVILESVSGYLLILNDKRQILAANQEILHSLKLSKMETLCGKRPGEALDCENARKAPGGCGTSQWCRHCGAVLALMASQDQQKTITDECAMCIGEGDTFQCRQFSVRVNPLLLTDMTVYVFVLHDISTLKRKQSLEKTLIHDMRNTLTSLIGWSEFLVEKTGGETANLIFDLSNRLNWDIEEHYLVSSIEKDDYIPQNSSITPEFLHNTMMEHFKRKEQIVFDFCSDTSAPPFRLDSTVLTHILAGMIKNGIEAGEGNAVTVTCSLNSSTLTLKVHNRETMDEFVQSRIFHPFFSTKKWSGKGMGTYTMRLLAERCLRGKIEFTSSEPDGTCFTLTIPV